MPAVEVVAIVLVEILLALEALADREAVVLAAGIITEGRLPLEQRILEVAVEEVLKAYAAATVPLVVQAL
jgi:hypothetical protein